MLGKLPNLHKLDVELEYKLVKVACSDPHPFLDSQGRLSLKGAKNATDKEKGAAKVKFHTAQGPRDVEVGVGGWRGVAKTSFA